jgi:predicted dehydrogenase
MAAVYLIGAGVIARAHAAAVRKLPGGESIPVYVTDPNPAAVESFREAFPLAQVFPSVDDLLAQPAGAEDIVIVATPPVLHHSLSIRALRSGRHVLCEKPLAMTTLEAGEMLAAARAADRRIGCCSSRFLGFAPTVAAREIIYSGQLGRLYHATFVTRRRRSRTGVEYQPSSPWFLDRSRAGGGTLMDWSPYDVTTLSYVLDPFKVEVQSAWTANPTTALNLPSGAVFDTEQHGGAALRYHLAGGSVVDVTYERSACTHGEERATVEIEGLDGAIRWDWIDSPAGGSLWRSADQDGQPRDETLTFTEGDGLGPHDRPLVYFYQAITGQGSPAPVDEQAVFNFSIIRAIYAAAETGRPQVVEKGGAL